MNRGYAIAGPLLIEVAWWKNIFAWLEIFLRADLSDNISLPHFVASLVYA